MVSFSNIQSPYPHISIMHTDLSAEHISVSILHRKYNTIQFYFRVIIHDINLKYSLAVFKNCFIALLNGFFFKSFHLYHFCLFRQIITIRCFLFFYIISTKRQINIKQRFLHFRYSFFCFCHGDFRIFSDHDRFAVRCQKIPCGIQAKFCTCQFFMAFHIQFFRMDFYFLSWYLIKFTFIQNRYFLTSISNFKSSWLSVFFRQCITFRRFRLFNRITSKRQTIPFPAGSHDTFAACLSIFIGFQFRYHTAFCKQQCLAVRSFP